MTIASRSQKVAYSFSQFGINMLWQSFNTVAVFYYVTVLHVSGVVLSSGMMLLGVMSALLNLVAGHLSDRTNTRHGRRIPYIMVASLPFAVLFLLLFHPFISRDYLVYFFVVTFLFDLSFTLTTLNIEALYPEMYRMEAERSYVSAWQQFFGILGMVVGVALVKPIAQICGWGTMGVLFSIIGALSMYASLYGAVENPQYRETTFRMKQSIIETIKNTEFVIFVVVNVLVQLATNMFVLLSSFYTKYVVALSAIQGVAFLGALFVVAIPVSFLWAKLSIHKTVVRATQLAALGYGGISLLFLFDRNPILVILTGLLLGIPVAGFLVLINVLLAEVIDVDAKNTGKRREGMYLGMNGLLVRLGMSLQYVIMAMFFSTSHFHPLVASDQVQVIWELRMLMGGLPVLLMLLVIWLLERMQSYRVI